MNTVIRHSENGMYRTMRGWSPNRNEALGFRSSLQALDHCCQHGLRQVVLVLQFSDPKFDIHLHPFPESSQKK